MCTTLEWCCFVQCNARKQKHAKFKCNHDYTCTIAFNTFYYNVVFFLIYNKDNEINEDIAVLDICLLYWTDSGWMEQYDAA